MWCVTSNLVIHYNHFLPWIKSLSLIIKIIKSKIISFLNLEWTVKKEAVGCIVGNLGCIIFWTRPTLRTNSAALNSEYLRLCCLDLVHSFFIYLTFESPPIFCKCNSESLEYSLNTFITCYLVEILKQGGFGFSSFRNRYQVMRSLNHIQHISGSVI